MAKKKPAAAKVLTTVATPDYWARTLDLRPANTNPGDTGDVGGALHHPPSVGGPGPIKGETGPGAGGGSGSGGGGTTETSAPIPDWEQQLIAIGMPAELVSQLASFYSTHATDPFVKDKALGIVRASDWWKQTFPGFWAGASSGLFSDETGYRSWYKAANDVFHRYYGRDLTANEVVSYLASGYGANTIEAIGAGHAYADANRSDIQWAEGAFDTGRLSEADLQAYGEQQTGRGSDLGARIQQRVDRAMAIGQRLFAGTEASPNLQLGSSGLSAPSLNPKQKPDVAA